MSSTLGGWLGSRAFARNGLAAARLAVPLGYWEGLAIRFAKRRTARPTALVKGAKIGVAALWGERWEDPSMAFSFVYLAVRHLFGALQEGSGEIETQA